ncbi:MAG: ABC transporter ATP-binding protein [Alphaproteobacteria bacterium]|nr:ABC transporter ATP-binding protein [Alphaproteobacteria bacterium]
MLEFKGVSHRYGNTPSVHQIDLAIDDGQVVSLLGPSGCGKSTILRLAAGLEQPLEGEIYLNGELIASPTHMVAPEKRGIGLVFQDYALFPHMTVKENILYGLNTQKISAAEKDKRVHEVLDHIDLLGFEDTMPHQMSGGQQQRVALARALAPKPNLILQDEPYAGLDSRLRERIRDDMLHILKELGTAVLMVTHDSEEAMFMSDNITVVREGMVEQSGRPIDLYCRPSNAFVAEFFGEVNRIDGKISNGKLMTPFGAFAVPGRADGRDASLIIRYEGLVIEGSGTPDADVPNAEVMETRLLGRYSLVHLSMAHHNGEELHLHARVPGLNMFSPGDAVCLGLDESQVFIFQRRLTPSQNI